MKKSILILSTVLTLGLLTTQARAQNFGFGIRGGVNLSKMTQANFDVGNPIGFSGGIYFSAPLYKNLIVLEPEVLYTRKGFEAKGNHYRIDYIEVPLNIRVNFVNSSNVLPFLYLGPYVAFKINTHYPGQIPEAVQPILSEDVRKTDFGVMVGGGIEFGHLSLGVRYETSLLDAFEDSGAKNRLYALSFVVGIGL